jgi:23S rRNA (uracil1939-C5)-methyltransferase
VAQSNKQYEAYIESLDQKGRGVARVNGKTIFVEEALPLEKIICYPTQQKSTFECAKISTILKPSAWRIKPICPHFGVCGGCSIQHVAENAQIALKQRLVEETLKHIGKVKPQEILPTISGSGIHYRHRARLSVRFVTKRDTVLIGFREKHTHLVANINTCSILPQFMSNLLQPLCLLFKKLSVAQNIPQIELSISHPTTILLLRLLKPLNESDKILLRAFIDQHTSSDHFLQFWFQPKGPDSCYPFYPKTAPALNYTLPEFNLTLQFRPTDFTQINPIVNQILVKKAVGLLAPRPNERIVDMFCGLGNFALPIARSGASVVGIEGSQQLVNQAKFNASLNGLSKLTHFLTMDLFNTKQIDFNKIGPIDKILLDPPRNGAIDLIKALPEKSAIHRIVYVSCDPATLARDAQILVHLKGYTFTKMGVVNLFPHTAHIETIASFEK